MSPLGEVVKESRRARRARQEVERLERVLELRRQKLQDAKLKLKRAKDREAKA